MNFRNFILFPYPFYFYTFDPMIYGYQMEEFSKNNMKNIMTY